MSFSPVSSFTGATDTVISGSTDKYLIFNTSGTVIFNTDTICKVLLVGGGGAGGTAVGNEGAGGGGGGGVGIGTIKFTANITYTVTVGNGGVNTNGSNSSIIGTNINELAYGGGRGNFNTGFDGGSGGGAAGTNGSGGGFYGGKPTMGLSSSSNDFASLIYYGNAGGFCYWVPGAAGGGGAQNMGSLSAGNNGTSGGAGIQWTVNSSYYGGGGGGGAGNGPNAPSGGAGGIGGGGNGGNNPNNVGAAGAANTGGGGGGGSWSGMAGGNGGTGIVIIRYIMHNNNIATTNTVYLSTVRNLLGLTGQYTLNNLRSTSTNTASSQVNLTSYLTSKLFKGLTSANPGKNALEIKNITGTTTDKSYFIMCNHVPTLIFCLMSNQYSGGGWMLIMKASPGSTFNFEANYWTTTNTLNSTDVTRNNADAKYDVFNYTPVKDVMAIWPDFGYTGGSYTISDGWTWLIDNWYNGLHIKAIDGFSVHSRNATPSDPLSFAGYKTEVFSTQSGARRHVFAGHSFIGGGVNNYGTVRWGFVWNNEGDFNSVDAWGGIGLSKSFTSGFNNTGKSAGDNYGCCGTPRYNRALRIELYGR
jgi:hypothetical protein